MLKLQATERTEKKALGVACGNGNGAAAQGFGNLTETVYCPTHGTVKAVWGQCERCFEEGLQDWDATRIAKELIPSWTGINPDGRQVIVTRVRDALDAVQKISQYKNSDAIVLIVWDSVVTALDKGRIGPSWGLHSISAVADDAERVDNDIQICAICNCEFQGTWGDEKLCDECYRREYGPFWR
jgi:hypothetical protein